VAPPFLDLRAVGGRPARDVHAGAGMSERPEIVITAGEGFVSALRLVSFVGARAAAARHRQQENRKGDARLIHEASSKVKGSPEIGSDRPRAAGSAPPHPGRSTQQAARRT